MFKFTIRDLLWLTLVVALGAAWFHQRVKLGVAEIEAIRTTERLDWLVGRLAEQGYRVERDSDPFWGLLHHHAELA